MAKVWLVTGSSRGLGRAIVEAALAAGDKVAATARNIDQLDDLVTKYGSERVLALPLDVTDMEQTEQVVTITKEFFGRIDVVVNNAGYADVAAIEDVTIESFRMQFETNFFGVVNMTKAVLPILRQQTSGHIMQVSSIGGRSASPGLGSYQSAKWAIGGFSSVLAKEVMPLGIKVTVLEPGGMKTDWAGSSMSVPTISEPYRQTVASFAEARQQLSITWTNPKAVAKAVIHISNIPEPPLRLLLCAHTVEIARKVADDLAISDEKWRHVTELQEWL